jgi:hypothetical protein
MEKRKFWPLDFDPEGEIYENLAWDLPGFRRHHPTALTAPVRPPRKSKRKPR